jgi:hypothetical protein
MTEHRGGCHCGNVQLRLHLAKPPEETDVRADQCSFCLAHGILSIADPAGEAAVIVEDERLLSRYRFGLRTADFLVCARCGVYVAAVCETPAGLKAVVNVRALAERVRFTRPARPVDYEGETVEQRIARRAERWMPVTVMCPSSQATG